MKTDLFDFELPIERIALRPCVPRDSSRLLVVDPNSRSALSVGGASAPLADRKFCDLADILKPTDVLVFNDTRVIASALSGVRARDDLRANVSINLLKRMDTCTWQVLAKPAKKLRAGDTIRFGNINLSGSTEQLSASVVEKGEAGSVSLKFNIVGPDLDKAISVLGLMPIPPYISSKRDADGNDFETYQTIFAQVDGAVAAPTAGLHFTQDMLRVLDSRGIERHTVTLHVGAGTFLPVKSDDTADHDMHSEWGTISAVTARALNEARSNGRRIIAVGTTSARLLETAARARGGIGSFEGDTAIFIQPGYTFKAVDGLITNFHLPRSTLFMLVSAFCGLDAMKVAYAHAISHSYRFYSYGDANLLFRKSAE